MPNTLKPSERMKIPRQHPIEQDAGARRHNFEEVSFGFDENLVSQEMLRCIDCKEPQCVDGCPVGIDIPGFIKLIVEKDYLGAARKIKEKITSPRLREEYARKRHNARPSVRSGRSTSRLRSASWSASSRISRDSINH